MSRWRQKSGEKEHETRVVFSNFSGAFGCEAVSEVNKRQRRSQIPQEGQIQELKSAELCEQLDSAPLKSEGNYSDVPLPSLVALWFEQPPTDREVVGSRRTENIVGRASELKATNLTPPEPQPRRKIAKSQSSEERRCRNRNLSNESGL